MDWSDLQEEYDRLGTLQAVADLHGCSVHKVWREMKRRGITAKGRGPRNGWTPEHRAAHKLGCNTDEAKANYRASLLKRLPSMAGPSANSPLELLLHSALQRAGVSFVTQRRKLGRYVVDIELLRVPVIIEADGALHRLHPDKDAARDAALAGAGHRVFRFTGTEINADPDGCVRQVMAATGVKADAEPIADIRATLEGRRSGVEFTCSECGAVFAKAPSQRTHAKTFCSQKCYGDWLRKHPEANPVRVRWRRRRTSQTVT